MKLVLIFNALASIVVLAAAYPTQGPVEKRSNVVEKSEDLTSNLITDEYKDRKREDLTSDLFIYHYHDRTEREE
ncbi:hypothetical protein EDD22DRAFT_891454 [Suillus occidentalis]|nr:hypothetical protein EDD22DRAFT_891454 [Suillus occidentalis]